MSTQRETPGETTAQLKPNQFEHEGRTYEIKLKKFRRGKKEYTAEEAAADARVRAELVELAWEGPDNQPREEEEFAANGIMVIVY